VLDHVAIFDGIPLDGLARLGQEGTRRSFPAGSVLMAQGEESDSMHIIVSGEVRVERSHPDLTEPIELAVLGPGQVVGEMGVLDGGPRSATVTAIADTETLEIAAPLLGELVLRFPEATRELLAITSGRIRSADELAIEIKRKGLGKRAGDPDPAQESGA